MDTKSRNANPFWAWLSFFLGINIVVFFLFSGLAALDYSGGNFEILKSPFSKNYQDTISFKERTARFFDQLTYLVTCDSPGDSVPQQVIEEGDNLICCAVNQSTGLTLKNFEEEFSFPASNEKPILPKQYSYYWYFDGQKLQVIDNGRPIDTKRLDSGYRQIIPRLMINDRHNNSLANLSNTRILLAVKDTLEGNPYGNSGYYREQRFLSIIGSVYGVLALLALALLVFAVFNRQGKCDFDRILARRSGRLWVEAKILLSVMALAVLMTAVYKNYLFAPFTPEFLLNLIIVSLIILMVGWWFYLMLIDLLINRKAFFTHNLINYLLTWYRKYETRYPWQKMILKRTYALLAAETILALLSVFFLLISTLYGNFGWFIIAIIFAATGLYLIFRYLRRYNQTITSLGRIVEQIELIKTGDMTTRLELGENDNMYPTSQSLNSIQEGMSIAVAERTKSERMKMELITNVSHDLKTPLTSIISYVDLLAREESLPEHVNDYIGILAQKSERLKNLIQDLFDLSKASSENIALNMEKIDLARLIKQAFADMEEQIVASGLAFRVNIPEYPVFIKSDGDKLRRVWENLITNTLKYSLPGSRVFIDLVADDKEALATIKNIANYEMDFDPEDILQRFVRGDESRSTEGSGLGLSIAQSFTEICGGQFSINIDGDLFKVELRFELV